MSDTADAERVNALERMARGLGLPKSVMDEPAGHHWADVLRDYEPWIPQPWWIILTDAIDYGTWLITCDVCGERVWFASNTREAVDAAFAAHRLRCVA